VIVKVLEAAAEVDQLRRKDLCRLPQDVGEQRERGVVAHPEEAERASFMARGPAASAPVLAAAGSGEASASA
jgi:hypothetical protein